MKYARKITLNSNLDHKYRRIRRLALLFKPKKNDQEKFKDYINVLHRYTNVRNTIPKDVHQIAENWSTPSKNFALVDDEHQPTKHFDSLTGLVMRLHAWRSGRYANQLTLLINGNRDVTACMVIQTCEWWQQRSGRRVMQTL